jgi:hypothetical protein
VAADDVPLRELLEQRLADERRYYDKRFDEIADALAKASEANERRLEGLNEWRQQSKDREANWTGIEDFRTFRETWRIAHEDLAGRFSELAANAVAIDRFDALERAVSVSAGRRTAIAGGAGVLVAVVALLFTQLSRSIPTHAQIQGQIVTEAPWLQDKPAIEARITRLEVSEAKQDDSLAGIVALDKFFCHTRAPKLPGC